MYKVPVTILFILLIIYLLWVDRKKVTGVSKAIWIPLIWMLFSGSREISFWLNYWFSIGSYAGTLEEGNPYERVYYSIMIVSAVLILNKRKLNLHELFFKNIWIWLYFLFAFISLIWSDYPFVSFKRWIKALGTLFIVLIILTEEEPYKAIGVIIRRVSFILLPLSVLFIWYYPNLSKSYHNWSGVQMITGVTDHKNALGMLCLVSGIYFSWHLLVERWQMKDSYPPLHFSICFIIVAMIAWLLFKANSATSLTCFLFAISLFAVARFPVIAKNPRMILTLLMASVILYGIMEWAFDVQNTIIAMLGRRPDLTTRVPMWEELLTMVKNPIIGYGYDSFWLGERKELMIAHWGLDRQSHNGYLDMYLNSGLIGLIFVLAWVLSGLRKVQKHLMTEYPNAILRLCIILTFILYSWTETVFYGPSNMLILFFFAIMDSLPIYNTENAPVKRPGFSCASVS